jgi:4-diphosphocytidyl-2-C-methyl-D-erythritol kinase
VPAAAGLGGGSSDAAATLAGLNTLWRTGLGVSDLQRLGARLGSDVPFFVRGGAAVMVGRGDEVQALPPMRGRWLILVVPSHTILDKTRRLYAELDASDFSPGNHTERAAKHVEHGLAPAESDLVNGFERAARRVFPSLTETWAEAERLTDRRFFLSGAGPTIFAFVTDHRDGRRQQERLAQNLAAETYLVQTARYGHARLKSSDRI